MKLIEIINNKGYRYINMYLEKFEMPFFLKIDDGIIFNLKEFLKENEDLLKKALLITDKTLEFCLTLRSGTNHRKISRRNP